MSTVAGKTAEFSAATAAGCALAPDVTITKGCAVVMGATSAIATAVDIGARGVEQVVRPNTGKVVIDGTKDFVLEGVKEIPKVGPILVPVASTAIDLYKDSDTGKSIENTINNSMENSQ